MRENADLFEEMGIRVMQKAEKTDRKEAAVALDCQLRVSPSLSLYTPARVRILKLAHLPSLPPLILSSFHHRSYGRG